MTWYNFALGAVAFGATLILTLAILPGSRK